MQTLKTEIREKLIFEAKRSFLESNFKNSSMRSIAEASGVTVGNVYRYFKNKEDLFYEVVAEAYNSIMEIIDMDHGSSINLGNAGPGIGGYGIVTDKVLQSIINVFIEYRQEINILICRSYGSRFENVKSELESLIADKIHEEIFSRNVYGTIDLSIFTRTLANTCVDGISSICASSMDDEQMQKNIYGLILYLFEGAKFRLLMLEKKLGGDDIE